MKNFRDDKKLKRKKQHKDWRKKKNILDQYKREETNRRMKGLKPRGPRVTMPKSKRYQKPKHKQEAKPDTSFSFKNWLNSLWLRIKTFFKKLI